MRRPGPIRHDDHTSAREGWDLLEPASGDVFYAWAIGVIGALALAVYGWTCISTQSATAIGDDGATMQCYGRNAVALGLTYIAVACLLHLHFFWSWRERFIGYAQIGKVLSLIGAVSGIFYFLWHFWLD